MRMDEKGQKNTTKVDPPQKIDEIKFENEVGMNCLWNCFGKLDI